MARGFLLYLFGKTLFSNGSHTTISLRYLQFPDDLLLVKDYDWGGAALCHLLHSMREHGIGHYNSLSGFFPFLQMWGNEHFSFGRPSVSTTPLIFPISSRWVRTGAQGLRCNEDVFRSQFDLMTPSQLTMDPFSHYTEFLLCPNAKFARDLSSRRIVLIHRHEREWHLGERMFHQLHGEYRMPMAPPSNMDRPVGLKKAIKQWEAMGLMGSNFASSSACSHSCYEDWYRSVGMCWILPEWWQTSDFILPGGVPAFLPNQSTVGGCAPEPTLREQLYTAHWVAEADKAKIVSLEREIKELNQQLPRMMHSRGLHETSYESDSASYGVSSSHSKPRGGVIPPTGNLGGEASSHHSDEAFLAARGSEEMSSEATGDADALEGLLPHPKLPVRRPCAFVGPEEDQGPLVTSREAEDELAIVPITSPTGLAMRDTIGALVQAYDNVSLDYDSLTRVLQRKDIQIVELEAAPARASTFDAGRLKIELMQVIGERDLLKDKLQFAKDCSEFWRLKSMHLYSSDGSRSGTSSGSDKRPRLGGS